MGSMTPLASAVLQLWSCSLAISGCPGFFDTYGDGCAASTGVVPALLGSGCPQENANITLVVKDAPPARIGFLVVGAGHGLLFVNPFCSLQVTELYPPFAVPIALDPSGDTSIPVFLPALPAPEVFLQLAVPDPLVRGGVAASRGLEINVGT